MNGAEVEDVNEMNVRQVSTRQQVNDPEASSPGR